MYYSIDTTCEPKVIGSDYPQMEILHDDVIDGLDLLSRRKGKLVQRARRIFNLKMGRGAKLTDVISCSLGAGGDFIVSKRFYEILTALNCNSVQFFPMQFRFKSDIIRDYRWVHFTYAFESHIDFFKSEYDETIMKGMNKNKPASHKEYLKLIDTDSGKYNWLRLKKTHLKKTFPVKEDLFVLCQANQKKYVSPGLYNKIIGKKITGLDITELNDV